ncbi:AraC family transcriptional regulator [Nocardia panacis]|uniref:AraC family transcriptional regulator n=1 Tax=Nocardia panacis TaxID=2340916 RepID=A0A3A4KTA0_9NOCA|nr:AraC family transcriptional regulator [Nocardia panacis]RJO79375.1 AraC family transcriptional regulator [Nocardia panacis]
MDPFDDLLSRVRAAGAVFGKSALTAPFALRLGAQSALTLCVPLRGEGWVVAGDERRRLRVGEAAVVLGPQPFVFTDDPDRAGPVIDAVCEEAEMPQGDTVLLVGSYGQQVPGRLSRVLPPLLVVPDNGDCAPMRDFLESQLAGLHPGRQIVLDRLLDWLLVCTLRAWFDAEDPAWYRALGDEVVGPVLQAMHESPDAPWTLATLAARAGVSRTTLAKRFTDVVGEPPLSYLTDWRMTIAADLLTRPGATVSAVATRVGYADAFGFSAAFKRVRGVSPSAYTQPA